MPTSTTASWGLECAFSPSLWLYLAAGRLYDAPVLTADDPLARAPTPGVLVENARI